MSTATAQAVRPLHFDLPPLPYPEDALAPVISAETLSLHHGKHHKKYIDTMNELLAKEPVRGATLEDVVRSSQGKLFNNAGQAWNHNFYWESMAPKGGMPSGKVMDALKASFGGVKEFNQAFAKAAVAQFGSGWAWLVKGKDGKLKITTTGNADTPIAHGETPLLTADVWEHAYYLDYQNRRPDHVKDWLEKLANWSFAEKNLS